MVMKRPAATSAAARGAPPTKAPRADPVLVDCRAVQNALQQSDLPEGVARTLSELAVHSLTAYVEERHPYQVEAIEMIEETLKATEGKMAAQVQDLKTKVVGRDEENVRRQSAVCQAAREVAEKKGTSAHREADVVVAKLKTDVAEEARALAVAAQKEGNAQIGQLEKSKGKLTTFMKETLTPLQESKEAHGKAALRSFTKTLFGLGIDSALLTSVCQAFGRDAAARSEFDGVAVKNLEADLEKRVEALDAELQALEPARAKWDAVAGDAQAAHNAAGEALASTRGALKEAERSVATATAALRAAEDAVASHGAEVVAAQAALEDGEASLKNFQEMALVVFQGLKMRAPCTIAETTVEEQPILGGVTASSGVDEEARACTEK